MLEQNAANAAYQTFFGQMAVKIFEHPVHASEMISDQCFIPEVHHVVMQHQYIKYGKARDHIYALRRSGCLKDPVGSLCSAESFNTLPCKAIIRCHGIGKKDLRTGVHRILKLFVERTVHVGLMHAPLQRSE